MAKVSIQRKREILDSANGQFFTVEFVKKDGTTRIMTAKKWTEDAFANGSKNAQVSTLANKPNYYLSVDVSIGEFRAINLDTLTKCTVNKIKYEFK